MSLVKFNHRPQIGNIWEDFLGNTDLLDRNYNKSTVPAVNIKESENAFILELAVPGMDKKDFKVELEDNRLVVSAKKESTKEEGKEEYSRKEFSYQSFERSFTLPKNINNKEIDGTYTNGILVITIPKLTEQKLSKSINIT